MKLFTLIFAVYILLLTGMPCCVIDNCEDEHPVTEQNDTSHKAPDSDKGCNNCSPFFSCHSCCGFIIQDKLTLENIPVVYTIKTFPGYQYAYQREYVAPFWQPPRIA